MVKQAGVDKADDFCVDYVKVYQNENDLSASVVYISSFGIADYTFG